MLDKQSRQTNAAAYLILLAMFFVWPVVGYAAETTASIVSAGDVLKNISNQIPSLMKLVTAFAYVMGMFLVINGIMQLKKYGEQRTMMSSEHSLKGPLILLAVGAMLLYLPSSVETGMSTFWSNPNPSGYKDALGQQGQWSQFMSNCFLIVQLFGTIAFIRGLLILSHLGGSHGGQQSFGRGITHVIGGIFCINIYQFTQMILNTIGVTISGFNS